jgi:hypothetical protein
MPAVQLSSPEQADLRAELQNLFNKASLTLLLAGKDCGEKLIGNYTSNSNFPIQVLEVVTAAGQEGWIAQLVMTAAHERPQSQVFKTLAERVQKQAAAAVRAAAIDPYEVIWLSRSRPMVNRRNLRDRAKEMLVQNFARVFVVRGESKTGRSHSLYFFQHLAERENLESVDLNLLHVASRETELNAYQLAVSLDQRFGLNFPFTDQDHEKQATFKVEPFVQSFLRVLGKPGAGQYILIVDGFGHIEPAESGLRLIQRLAQTAETSLKNLRVVLLGLKEDLPLDIGGVPLREHTGEFTDADVTNFFERFYRDVLNQPAPNPAQIVKNTVEALSAAPQPKPKGKSNVAAISDKITEICRRLIQN